MSILTYVACYKKKHSSAAVLGLGGGGLCSFLQKFLATISVIGVDIDADMLTVAMKWFGLNSNKRLQTEIIDGTEFLEKCVLKGNIFLSDFIFTPF